jgi:ATP-dependent protease HslVU (ClpYQ) ATPase subunit
MTFRSKFKPGFSVYSILPIFLFSGLNGEASSETLKSTFIFFLKAGAFVFGSGLAIVPFLHYRTPSIQEWQALPPADEKSSLHAEKERDVVSPDQALASQNPLQSSSDSWFA